MMATYRYALRAEWAHVLGPLIDKWAPTGQAGSHEEAIIAVADQFEAAGYRVVNVGSGIDPCVDEP